MDRRKLWEGQEKREHILQVSSPRVVLVMFWGQLIWTTGSGISELGE